MSTLDNGHRRVRATPDPKRRRLIVTCACGQSYATPIPNTTTTQDWLQQAQRAHATQSARTCAAGCHVADIADHYLDIHRIPCDLADEAFADFLTLKYGWDGQFERVDLHIAN